MVVLRELGVIKMRRGQRTWWMRVKKDKGEGSVRLDR